MNKINRKIFAGFFMLIFMFVAVADVDASESKVINIEKTGAHRSIFDIPVYVVPAIGFNFTKTVGGCADKVKKVSLAASQIRVKYQTLREEFNDYNLKKAGLELKARSEFVWNGAPAMLLKVFQNSKTSVLGKWILVIDRGEETWIINALYEAKDQKRGEAVLSMIKSICWGKEEKPSVLTIPLGNINPDGNIFRLAGLMQGALVYTKDGVLPTKSQDGALFVVSQLTNTYFESNKRSSFAKERLEQIEKGKKLEIISEKDIAIEGLSGIELVAYTEEEPRCLIYQAMFFDYNNSHVLVGIARKNVPENLELFHTLAKSYKKNI